MFAKPRTIVIIIILALPLLGVCFLALFSKEPTDKFLSLINIQEDGSIRVRELVKLNGSYNGFERKIYVYNPKAKAATGTIGDIRGNNTLYDGSSITDLKVGSISDDGELTFDDFYNNINYFNRVFIATEGKSSLYTITDVNNYLNLKIYNPSKLDEIFYIEYTINDVVVVHNDIAELAWNVLGDGYNENIGNFEVRVVLPNSDDNYRVWLHGPLNGNILKNNNHEATGTFNFLEAHNPVSLRLIFDKSLVPEAIKYSGFNAKDAIIKYQSILSEDANKERDEARLINYIIIGAAVIWGTLSFAFALSIYLKDKKMKKKSFTGQYFRDFPGDYEPCVLEYLLDKKITEKSLSATILNLIYKKVLKVEKVSYKVKDDYYLVLQKYNPDSLSETEKLALKIIIEEIGDHNMVILSTIQRNCSNLDTAKKFIDLYDKFVKLAEEKAKREDFFTKIPSFITFSLVFYLLGLAVLLFSFYYGFMSLALAIIIMMLILIIYTLTRRFYTEKGALHYAEWMAHKRFLDDFSRFDEKELPEVTLWDKYLVYAIILGNADKLASDMKIKMASLPRETNNLYINYNPMFMSYSVSYNLFSSINTGIHTAITASKKSIAFSRKSNGSGFGGGSFGGSGGGGSIGGGGTFGGGGGGGRF